MNTHKEEPKEKTPEQELADIRAEDKPVDREEVLRLIRKLQDSGYGEPTPPSRIEDSARFLSGQRVATKNFEGTVVNEADGDYLVNPPKGRSKWIAGDLLEPTPPSQIEEEGEYEMLMRLQEDFEKAMRLKEIFLTNPTLDKDKLEDFVNQKKDKLLEAINKLTNE